MPSPAAYAASPLVSARIASRRGLSVSGRPSRSLFSSCCCCSCSSKASYALSPSPGFGTSPSKIDGAGGGFEMSVARVGRISSAKYGPQARSTRGTNGVAAKATRITINAQARRALRMRMNLDLSTRTADPANQRLSMQREQPRRGAFELDVFAMLFHRVRRDRIGGVAGAGDGHRGRKCVFDITDVL